MIFSLVNTQNYLSLAPCCAAAFNVLSQRGCFGKEKLIQTFFVHSLSAWLIFNSSQAGLELCGALVGLSYGSRTTNSTPVLLTHHICLIMNILQQEIFFKILEPSAAWIWIMSTAVAFLLNNHQSSGRQRAVGLSEVQDVESPGWYILPHLTTELVVSKAWVALFGPSINIDFPPSPPSLTMLLPLVGKQGKGTWEDARSFPHGEM